MREKHPFTPQEERENYLADLTKSWRRYFEMGMPWKEGGALFDSLDGPSEACHDCVGWPNCPGPDRCRAANRDESEEFEISNDEMEQIESDIEYYERLNQQLQIEREGNWLGLGPTAQNWENEFNFDDNPEPWFREPIHDFEDEQALVMGFGGYDPCPDDDSR